MYDSFADMLKELRQKKGYSQRKLGLLSGVSNSTISRLESGTSEPDVDTIKKLSPHLGVHYEVLLNAAGYIDIKQPLNKDAYNKKINYVKEAQSEYTANPENKKKKFLYELLKEMQEAGIINPDGNEILDDESAELILEDIKSKVKLIKRLKETDNKQK